MHRYLVISPHTAEDCKMAIKEFRKYNAGFLTHFEWGCLDNDHTAYAIIEAECPFQLSSGKNPELYCLPILIRLLRKISFINKA